jgi:hypothetical protein
VKKTLEKFNKLLRKELNNLSSKPIKIHGLDLSQILIIYTKTMELTLLPRKMPEVKVKTILTKPLRPFSVVFQDMTILKIFFELAQ